MLFDVPKEVMTVCSSLHDAGYESYLVGGSIRDLLLGRKPGDWDLATQATPTQVMEVFPRVVPTGIKHGTVTVLGKEHDLEVTTLRGEGAYSDGRHPDLIRFLTDIDEDLNRRDFTVNAIAWNPIEDRIHDPTGGRGDLDARVIRAVGEPLSRFEEDGLRVLRGARFASALDFDVEPKTEAAMADAAGMLTSVSMERKRDELIKLVSGANPRRGIRLMSSTGLFDFLFGDPADKPLFDGTDWEHAGAAVELCPKDSASRLAALFWSSEEGRRVAATSLKLDKKTRVRLERMFDAPPIENLEGAPLPPIRRLVRDWGEQAARDLSIQWRARLGAAGKTTVPADTLLLEVNEVIESGVPVSVSQMAVKGSDLISSLDISPGPEVGRLLDALLDHLMDKPQDNSPDKLMELAKTLLENESV